MRKSGRKSPGCCPLGYIECKMVPVLLRPPLLGSQLALHDSIRIMGPASCPGARRIPCSPVITYLIIIAEGKYCNLCFIILKQREEEPSDDLFASLF